MLVSHRVTNILLVLILAVGVGIVAMLASGVLAGPLDPPAAPGSTAGVREPGTPITAIPYTISQSGYYYLTGNLTATVLNESGITIDADDVTLDLKGFTMKGFSKTGTGIGIGSRKQIVVRNGIIDGFGYGLNAGVASRATYSGLTVTGAQLGMSVADALVEDCAITDNDGGIVLAGSTMRHCTVRRNQGNGVLAQSYAVIEDNVLGFNDFSHVGGYSSVYVDGTNVFVRNNYSVGEPFMIITATSNSLYVLGNRFDCSPAIYDLGFLTYYPIYPTSTAPDRNYCD